MRILVVEDEMALAEGLEFNFQQEGYDVDLAGDGPAAFQTLSLIHISEPTRPY